MVPQLPNYSFTRIDRNPWEASASKHGRNAKFSDDSGHVRGAHGVYPPVYNPKYLLLTRLVNVTCVRSYIRVDDFIRVGRQ